jgi:uncharacterized protein YktA (UPF0223 family)
MESEKFAELTERASKSEEKDLIKKLEARERILAEVLSMKKEGKALELSKDEIDLVNKYRTFKDLIHSKSVKDLKEEDLIFKTRYILDIGQPIEVDKFT